LFLSFRSDANDKGDLIKHAVIRREYIGDVTTYLGVMRRDEYVKYDHISDTIGSDVKSSCDHNNDNNNAYDNNYNDKSIYHFQHKIYDYYCGKLGPFRYLYEILQKISIIIIKPGLSFQKYENILIEDGKGSKWNGKWEWNKGKEEKIFNGKREIGAFNLDVNIDIWSYMKNVNVENDDKDITYDMYNYNNDKSSKSKGNDDVNEVDTDDSQYYKVDFVINFYTAIILFLSLKQYHSIQLKYLLYNHTNDDYNVVDDENDSSNYNHHNHIVNQQYKESNFSKINHKIGLNDKKLVFDFHHTIVEGIMILENRIKLLLKPRKCLWEEVIFDSSTRWDEMLFTKFSYSNSVHFRTTSDNSNRINDCAYYYHHQQHDDKLVNDNNNTKAIDRMTVLKQLNNNNTYHKYNIYLAEKLFHIIATYIHHRSKINSSSSSTTSSSTLSTTTGMLHNLHIPTMSGNCGNSSISFIKFIGCGNCQGSGVHDYYLRSDECIEITECKEVLHLWRHLYIKHENMKTEMKLMELHTNHHHTSTTTSSSQSSVSHQQSQSLSHLHSTASISSDDIDTSIIGFHTRITLSTLSREVSRRSWVNMIDRM
jgi:hypothetical protein